MAPATLWIELEQLPAPPTWIVAGKFWDADTAAAEYSVEEGIAKSLGINLGDTLTFDIAGARYTATVTSLRKVDWDSFKPNFFVIASPKLLRGYPASWITSFHLPAGREDVVSGLVREFPNVSVIDLSALMAQFQRITDQVSRAVEFVFLFAIAAGLVVLFAAIASTQDERIFEGAILRTLGASRRQLAILQLAEFLAIGLLSGAVAAAGSVALAMVLADREHVEAELVGQLRLLHEVAHALLRADARAEIGEGGDSKFHATQHSI